MQPTVPWLDRFALFTTLDYVAVATLSAVWIALGWVIENPPARRPSLSILMGQVRKDWMVVMLTREPRIFDAQIVASLRQGTAFFASACMISIGGLLAVVGNTEKLLDVAGDLTATQTPAVVFEVKLLLVVFFVTHAFLKLMWAHRLFGYCSVLMGAVPNDPTDPEALMRVEQAGKIHVTAARGFNRGLRGIYFALASLAWLLGPLALFGAIILTLWTLLRREFASESRGAMVQGRP